MTKHTLWLSRPLGVIIPFLSLSLIFSLNSISNGLAQTKLQPNPKIAAFYNLVSGKWTKLTDNAHLTMTTDQLNIAALQCHSAKNIDAKKASDISSISKSISQRLSNLLIYQKLETGLIRINFETRRSLLFPKLMIEGKALYLKCP